MTRQCRWETAADAGFISACFHFLSGFEREQNLVCFITVSQREAKVQLFRDAVDAYSELITQVNKGQTDTSFCVLLKADQPMFLLFRHLKGMESIATCWAWSCRPSRKDTVFLKFSWTQPTVWPHTGSSEQGRCVSFVFSFFLYRLSLLTTSVWICQ